jgi:hypothetical protein
MAHSRHIKINLTRIPQLHLKSQAFIFFSYSLLSPYSSGFWARRLHYNIPIFSTRLYFYKTVTVVGVRLNAASGFPNIQTRLER